MFALIISVSLYAFDSFSKLKLRMWDYSSFTIELNGNYFSNPTNNFVASNLAPGNHLLKIYKIVYGPYVFLSNRILIYSGVISIPASSKIVARIDSYNNLDIIKVEPLYDYNLSCYSNNNSYNSNQNSSYNNESYNSQSSYCMSNYAFSNLKNLMVNNAFDSNRLKMAKQAISMNSVCSQQVYELMNLLSFESSKLNLAKFSYNHVTDKENYFIVNNAFSFSSSIDELNKAIYRY